MVAIKRSSWGCNASPWVSSAECDRCGELVREVRLAVLLARSW